MGKKSAPKFATTTYNTGGLFGSSTTSKKGTTFNPTSWQTQTMSTVGSALPTTLNSLISGDFSNDANYQAYQNNLNKQMSQAYDTDVLGQLASRGLMRSSGLQSATNSFANTLANNQMNLYDSYYNRQANNLANLLNTSNTLYNYIMGVNQGSLNTSNAVNQHNLQRWQNSNNNSLWSTLANAAGGIGGSALGSYLASNPVGAVSNASSLLSGGSTTNPLLTQLIA